MKRKDIFDLVEENPESFIFTLGGFEYELYNFLKTMLRKDKWILGWTVQYLEIFIKDFAENYMKFYYDMELKNSSPYEIVFYSQFIFRFDDFMEINKYGINYPIELDKGEKFKWIDVIRREYQKELDNNPEAVWDDILKKSGAKAEKLIELEKIKVGALAKKKLEEMRDTLPEFYDVEYVTYKYGFPLDVSLIVYKHLYEDSEYEEHKIILRDLLKY